MHARWENIGRRGLVAVMVGVATLLAGAVRLHAAEALTAQQMVADANKVIKSVSAAEAKAELGKSGVIFLDVREPNEFGKGHIPGAVAIPRGLLEFRIASEVPDKTARIIVYCQVGGRGALATQTLGTMGYTNVVNMKGAWEEWLKAGYPAQ